jgi:photosystem II stability/assembly factor-like uncharacterized protein
MTPTSKRFFIFLTLTLVPVSSALTQWRPQQSGTTVRLRGLSASNEKVAWASGGNGTFLRTMDGGENWQCGMVPGAETLDFRDVQAVDANTAYLLSIGLGDTSRIYKTKDGGKNWQLQFINRNPKAFFDAFAFWDADHGIALSDPVDGRFLVIATDDGGSTWKELPLNHMPPAIPREGAFAASGTCIAVQGKNHVWFGTGGGDETRVFMSSDRGRSWSAAPTPVKGGNASSGIFSIAFKDELHGVVVGGDYRNEQRAEDNVAITSDGGKTWSPVRNSMPGGYRSAVDYVSGPAGTWVAVGPSGTDYSLDNGVTWTGWGSMGFDSVSVTPRGAIWASGDRGRIARMDGPVSEWRNVTGKNQ